MSRREIAQLTGLLQRVLSSNGSAGLTSKPAPKRRARRRRRARKSKGVVNTPSLPYQPGAPARPSPSAGRSRILGDAGQMRVARQELCAVLTTGDKGDVGLTVLLDPARSGAYFPWLHGLVRSWERIVWHSLKLTWRSAVGTTTDGMIAYAVDFNSPPSSAGAAREDVVSHHPVNDHPLWQSTDVRPLVIPASMLRSRTQFILAASDLNDAAPGSIQVSIIGGPSSKKVGEIWVHYDVTLSGPRKADSQVARPFPVRLGLSIWDFDAGFSQVWKPKGEFWVEGTEENKGVEQHTDIREVWDVTPKSAVLRRVDPAKRTVTDKLYHPKIDTISSSYNPIYSGTIMVPKWLASLTGSPTFVSLNVFAVLDGPKELHWHSSSGMKPTLTFNVKDLIRNAQIGSVAWRFISPTNLYMRIAASGLLDMAEAAQVDFRCSLFTGLDVGNWPEYSVSYHVLLACGLDSVTNVTKVSPWFEETTQALDILPDTVDEDGWCDVTFSC